MDVFILFFRFYFYLLCIGVLPIYLSVCYMCAVPTEARRGLNPLEMELHTVVSHHAAAGN